MKPRRGGMRIALIAAVLSPAALPLFAQPSPEMQEPVKGRVSRSRFGQTAEENPVELFTLTNTHGLEVRVINYGGFIVSLCTPDRHGRLGDVVLGHDDMKGYLAPTSRFGAIIGRYANRIAKGRFTLDDKTYALATNSGLNHIHGGLRGFDKVLWEVEPVEVKDGVGIVLSYTSPDGEEGYPGTLQVRVTYTLTDRDELVFDYFAVTDKATPVNLTQHTCFNLAGDGTRDVLEHELQLLADHYLPVDTTRLPTGVLAPVKDTPFDFRERTAIGARINQKDEQLANSKGGYDHNFVLNRSAPGLTLAARVLEPTTGRVMEIETTEPGMQLYTGNSLNGTITGKEGRVYRQHYALCLETQHYPDSPNQPSFPTTILRPGEEYRSTTVLRFSTVP